MVSVVFLPLTQWESVICTMESRGSEGKQVPVQVLGTPMDAGRGLVYLPCSIFATPLRPAPPREPQGPGAQSLLECTTGWLSPRPLI